MLPDPLHDADSWPFHLFCLLARFTACRLSGYDRRDADSERHRPRRSARRGAALAAGLPGIAPAGGAEAGPGEAGPDAAGDGVSPRGLSAAGGGGPGAAL